MATIEIEELNQILTNHNRWTKRRVRGLDSAPHGGIRTRRRHTGGFGPP